MTQEDTKAKLIEAAGEEFAEKGFEGATVRSITLRAGVNPAAVNYHFGDKTSLYEQTLLEVHRCDRFDHGETVEGLDPADRLRAFVGSFVENVFDTESRGWQRTLMLREMLHPTSASDLLVREAIRPRFELLKSLIRAFRPEADDDALNALAFSVVGQILHYKIARHFSERLIGPEAYARLDKAYLARHIAEFCLAALRRPVVEAGARPPRWEKSR